MKKILVDAYLAKNLGDDLFLKVIFERYCNVEWTVIVTQIEYKHIFKEFKNVNIIYINKFFRGLKKYNIFDVNTYYKRARNYDALVFIGGSIFMQKNNYLELYKYRREIIDNFKENNKPVFILGANFGPFKDKEFLNNYKNLFSQCEDVCFREEYSFSLFKELKNIRVSPDIIFGMQSNNIKKEKGTIGFSLINLEKREELAKYQFFYDNKIKELIELYIYNGKKITLFSFCESEGDMIAINRVLDLLDEKVKNKIEVCNYTGNINVFLDKYKKQESIIGCRFHSIILSQVFKQGVYPLIYSDKTYNVLKDINLNNEYMYIENIKYLDAQYVYNVIKDNTIKDNNILKEAEKQFEGLDKYVESNK